MKSKWAIENFPHRTQMTLEQVAAIGGKFFSSGCNRWDFGEAVWLADDSLHWATWFVPLASHEPVMVLNRKTGTWNPRGF